MARRYVVASMAATYRYTARRTNRMPRKGPLAQEAASGQTTSLKQVYRVLQMIEEQLKLVSIIA